MNLEIIGGIVLGVIMLSLLFMLIFILYMLHDGIMKKEWLTVFVSGLFLIFYIGMVLVGIGIVLIGIRGE